MASGIAASDRQGGGREVRREESRTGKFFRQHHNDAAGAGADIGDQQAVARRLLRAAQPNFAEPKPVERNLD